MAGHVHDHSEKPPVLKAKPGAPQKARAAREPGDPTSLRTPGAAPPPEPPRLPGSPGSLQRAEDPRLAPAAAARLSALQRAHGNQYVQRLLAEGAAAPQKAIPTTPEDGQPLSRPIRSDMEQRFGTALDDVRIHAGTDAATAARALGARAFTAGQDIYFAQGAFQPETPPGRRLLAHELAHTIQQREQPQGRQGLLEVAPPADPREAEAERAADAVAGPSPASGPVRLHPAPAPGVQGRLVQRQPEGAPAAGPTGPAAPTGGIGPQASGDFVIGLGGGLKVPKEEIDKAKRSGRLEKDLGALSLPGMKVKRLSLGVERDSGEIKGGHVSAELAIPWVKPVGGGVKYTVEASGKASLTAKAKIAVPALNEPQVVVTLKDGQLSGEVTLSAEDFKFRGLPKLKIPAASATVGIADGKLTGTGSASLEYTGLAKGDFSVEFKDGTPAGKGRVELTPDYLKGVAAGLEIAEGQLAGEISVPASKLQPPVPGLSISDGTIVLGVKNGALKGSGENIAFAYQGLGAGVLNFSIVKDHAEGSGTLELSIPGLAPVKGSLGYRDGRLSGKATITADKFPKALPVRGGSITVGVGEKGEVSGKGAVDINLFGIGEGSLVLGYDKGILDLGAEVVLRKIPILEEGRVKVGLKEGKLEGEGQIAIAPAQVPGLTGTLLVVYKDDRFSGKTRIGYARDKFAGEVELFLLQDEKGKMAVSGSGEVTARLTDWLTGKVHVDVAPDATTKIAGQLKADDVELFPAKKADRELFSVSQNIPLWAILVAVIRLRGGVRGGVGPGMLRGVTAEGEFSTEPGVEPSFSVTGELFIPAYAEAYIAFGAGLGLDVVIGELTGGIEAVGTAGIYGAVSVIPEIAYEGGNFSISGVATLAAGAKLKLGLQAWAEVEAFWITVWENTWQLAEWVWDVGPELALQAEMKYVFGRPEPPSFELKTSDIDADRLIQDAMPKDAPRGSGARDALKNTAAWKGALKAERKDASKIPPELAEKSAKAPTPKAPPPKPPRKSAPADLKSKDPAKTKEMLAKDLKEKGAPEKSKAPDKAHDERATKGFAELDRLAVKAKSDPEEPPEIARDLAALKAKYGFTTLTHRLEKDEWVVDAAMSPGREVRIPARVRKIREQIEGLVGTYSSLSPGAAASEAKVGDKVTPDHEPQDRLMLYVSGKREGAGSKKLLFIDQEAGRRKPLFEGTDVAGYSHGDGVCMNIASERHQKTRSYGTSPTKEMEDIQDEVESIEDNLSPSAAKATVTAARNRARRKAAGIVRDALDTDRDRVREIYGDMTWPDMTDEIKERALGNLRRVLSENKSRYPEAFEA